MISKPLPGEYAEYYEKYIRQVPSGNIIEVLKEQQKTTIELLSSINEEKSNYRYASDKWSIKEVLGHIIDGERVFGYRALRFSRNDQKQLSGFEQNDYIANSNYSNIQFQLLIKEFEAIRTSNILMFAGFTDEMLLRKGNASNNEVSVRALAYIMAGHAEHHIKVLKEKYGC